MDLCIPLVYPPVSFQVDCYWRLAYLFFNIVSLLFSRKVGTKHTYFGTCTLFSSLILS